MITSAPLQSGNIVGRQFGMFPVVIRLRTNEYGLYYTAGNRLQITLVAPGESHFMTSPFAQKGNWFSDRVIYAAPTGTVDVGFGRVSPIRKFMDGIELVHSYDGNPRRFSTTVSRPASPNQRPRRQSRVPSVTGVRVLDARRAALGFRAAESLQMRLVDEPKAPSTPP